MKAFNLKTALFVFAKLNQKLLPSKITLFLFLPILSFGQPYPGAWQTNQYLPLLNSKKVGLVVNHTSLIDRTHLVDSLLKHNVKISRLFSPEHGIRGDADAGAQVESGTDQATGLLVHSLYGDHKKPTTQELEGLEVMIFDLQDVGVRFFTYISTLHLVMEACAENNVPLIILDRPNPNGWYIDGPVLHPDQHSFVGMHPIPVVYGMTVGELALMINGEQWLSGGVQCDITIIPNRKYDHRDRYELPVKPSPNLPNSQSVMLYPSLCLFEGTKVSVGRGTTIPFTKYGYPDPALGSFTFVPKSIPGMSKNPPYRGETCFGKDLSTVNETSFTIRYLLEAYHAFPQADEFFNSYFDKLAGNSILREQIQAGIPEEEIRITWQEELSAFMRLRQKYLLYPDFNR